MRRLLLLSLLSPLIARAQATAEVGYQGRLMDASGSPISAPTSITFKLFGSADAVADQTVLTGTLKAPVEPSHQVGNPGEPAYLNFWSGSQDGRYDVGAQYYMVSTIKEVVLLGLLKTPSSIQSGSAIFVLPAGYRPGKIKIFVVAVCDAFGLVEVGADGVVSLKSGGCASGSLSLTGIRFRAEQ